MLLGNLIELLGYDALGVIKRLVAIDIFRAGKRGGRRNFISEAIGLIKGTKSLYFGSRPKDSRKEVVALGKFDLRLRLRFLYTVRHFVSAYVRSKVERIRIAQGTIYL